MKDKWSIKKVLESQGDVHEKVANQSNLELPSSSPTQSSGPPHIQIDVQIAYDLRFRCSTYEQKANEIIFPMDLVSCPTKVRVVCNHQNGTDFQNYFWCYATILARWAMYPVGVHQGCILGFSHDPRPFIFSRHHHFMWVFLRLICQEQFLRHLVCKDPNFHELIIHLQFKIVLSCSCLCS
jgi:hypothetical protein